MRSGNDLHAWYKKYRVEAGHEIIQVNDLTVKMLGTNTKRKLKTKAAETRWLIPFALEMLEKHYALLGDCAWLTGAGNALTKFIEALEGAPGKLTIEDLQVSRPFQVR